jgi:hypothetical protein
MTMVAESAEVAEPERRLISGNSRIRTRRAEGIHGSARNGKIGDWVYMYSFISLVNIYTFNWFAAVFNTRDLVLEPLRRNKTTIQIEMDVFCCIVFTIMLLPKDESQTGKQCITCCSFASA